MLAMKRAVEGLSLMPTLVQIDGNRCPTLMVRAEAIVGGDALVPRASRRRRSSRKSRATGCSVELHARHPVYGFDVHAMRRRETSCRAARHGPCEAHRRSFAPCARHRPDSMKSITSRDNPLYKRLKALAGSTAQQRRGGHALLEGFHLAGALSTRARSPSCASRPKARSRTPKRRIVARIDAPRVVTLPDALFGQLSNVVSGVGLLLLVERPAQRLPARVTDTSVVLDGVQDAGNVGDPAQRGGGRRAPRVLCAGPRNCVVVEGAALGHGRPFLCRFTRTSSRTRSPSVSTCRSR
jgi:hypothetical protein